MESIQPILLLTGDCPRVIVDELQYVEFVEIRNTCNDSSTEINRWDIAVSLHTERPYSLYGHCKCSKDEPDCYVERRTNGLYKSQGRCSGTNCSKQFDSDWMEAAHSDCAAMLGCSSRCQIPPECSGASGHDFWRCMPESEDKAKVKCTTARSESAADAESLQAACMKLKADRAEPGVMKRALLNVPHTLLR